MIVAFIGAVVIHTQLISFSFTETICIVNRRDYNVKLFDILNFVLLYMLPLMVMTVRIDSCFPSRQKGRNVNLKLTAIVILTHGTKLILYANEYLLCKLLIEI